MKPNKELLAAICCMLFASLSAEEELIRFGDFESWISRTIEESAIIGGKADTAAAKMQIMRECGIKVVESPADMGKAMAELLK